MIAWYSTCGCLLLYFYDGTQWWTQSPSKLFINEFCAGLNGSLPLITVTHPKTSAMLLRTTYGVSVSKYIEMFSGAVKEYVSPDDGGEYDWDDDDSYGYTVMNPTTIGINDWETFKNNIRWTTAAEAEQAAAAEESELGPESYLAGYNPAEVAAVEPAASYQQVSRQKLFKDYVNDKVTELGDGPKYGIMYMQALTHTNTSMPLAEAVVAAAKANRVPLIVDFNDAFMSSEE